MEFKKKYSQPKSGELCFIWWEFLGLQTQEIAFQVTLSERFWGAGGGVRLYRSLQQGEGSLNIKRLLIKKKQISEVKEFSDFLCMARCKSLGLLKPFLSYAAHLSRASLLFSHPELPFLGPHHREWLQFWLLDSRYSPSSRIPLGLNSSHLLGLQSLLTVPSLFTDMAGNTLFHIIF